MPLGTKISSVMAYNEELPPTKPYGPLNLHYRNAWSHQTLQRGALGIVCKFRS